MKTKFKVGDAVFAINNPGWGREAMTIQSVNRKQGRALCRHPKFPILGLFYFEDMIKRNSEEGQKREEALCVLQTMDVNMSTTISNLFQKNKTTA